jgi:hypothetical protein
MGLREVIKKSPIYPVYKYFMEQKTRLLRQLKYIVFGIFHGIDIKYDWKENAKAISSDYAHYQPLFSSYVKIIMDCFVITDSDKLFDWGSGKGAAMIFFARYPFSEIGGVELMRGLHEAAIENFKRKKFDHLISYNEDASRFENIDQYNYFFFYGPFMGKVMEQVIANLRKSLFRCPRRITIISQGVIEKKMFLESGLFAYIRQCFVSSICSGRHIYQYIDIYSNENLCIDFNTHRRIKILP